MENVAYAVGMKDWVVEQRRQKWTWAGHVARRLDGRWTNKLLHWIPAGARKRGRPYLRWGDVITNFWRHVCGSEEMGIAFWSEVAETRDVSDGLENDFLNFCEQ